VLLCVVVRGSQDRALLLLKLKRCACPPSSGTCMTDSPSFTSKAHGWDRGLMQCGWRGDVCRYKEAESEKADKQLLNVYQMVPLPTHSQHRHMRV
jgi:hypothetical protein